MKHIIFLLLIICLTECQPITATFKRIEYQPTIFQLQFSEKVSQPTFQVLLNNAIEINFHFITSQTLTETYQFQVDSQSAPNTQNLQTYQLFFNNPVKVGNGRLALGCFILKAQNSPIQVPLTPVMGYLLVAITYAMFNFSVLGQITVQFIQFFCVIMFHNGIKSSLYHQMSQALFLLNPVLTDGTYKDKNTFSIILVTPLILVWLSGAFGFLMKRYLTDDKSIVGKIFKQFAVYNFFANVGNIFIFPMFFNALQCFSMLTNGTIQVGTQRAVIGFIFAYFNAITTFFLLYLFIYVLNPKINQPQSSWKLYLKSQQFDIFRKIHDKTIVDLWYKRNMRTFLMLKRLTVACLFFMTDYFEQMIILLEIINFFYTFTVRPCHQHVQMGFAIINRLLIFIFYIIVVLGNLYFSIGDITFNYQIIKAYLMTRTVIFILIVFTMFSFMAYEVYLKCSNLNYQIKVVREENQYKLKITEKQRTESESRPTRSKSFTSSEDVYQRNNRFSTYDDSMDSPQRPKRAKKGSNDKIVKTPNRSSKEKITNSLNDKSRLISGSKNELQIQLRPQPSRSRRGSNVTNESQRTSKIKKSKKKWKEASLLAQMLQNK